MNVNKRALPAGGRTSRQTTRKANDKRADGDGVNGPALVQLPGAKTAHHGSAAGRKRPGSTPPGPKENQDRPFVKAIGLALKGGPEHATAQHVLAVTSTLFVVVVAGWCEWAAMALAAHRNTAAATTDDGSPLGQPAANQHAARRPSSGSCPLPGAR
ncbi:unnamed protein product [Clonostachys solani]|uniref:Uncharacterized protein n=1 Tax=Clonostachys solani TaxID=160281 RepID=A0A9N9W0Y8_9HYPO|nr:unnamed protein product [Clonostachys solani]